MKNSISDIFSRRGKTPSYLFSAFFTTCVALFVGDVRGETTTVDDMNLTADVTVDVAAGSTQNVVRLTGGAYTLTKTGGGTLNIYWTANENVRIVVEEGVVALPRYAKPTAVFAKAHYHVDASAPSTMVTEYVNGTNFVVRWNDADGRTCYATNCPSTAIGRTNPENRRPFIRPHFQNGLPVVDFGSLLTAGYTDEHGAALGYGGAMLWSEPLNSLREGFTVFSDTEDIFDPARQACGGFAASFFASFSKSANYREMLSVSKGGAPYYTNHDYCAPFARSTNVVDLTTYFRATHTTGQPECTYTRVEPGFHLLNAISSAYYVNHATIGARYLADAFAASVGVSSSVEGTYTFGGQRIGEYAVFSDWLSQAERDEVSIYLKTKWFPRKFAGIEVKAGATFDASEGGMEGDVVGEDGAAILSGASSIVVNPVHPWKTVLHLDASEVDTLDTVQVGGTNFVGRWSDCSGSGAYATTNTEEAARAPFINPSETLNGLPFVDFGSLRTEFNTNGVGEALGYGAALKFDTVRTYAEGITVAADTPDVVNGDWLSCPEYGRMHGMAFFATYTGTYGSWQRGPLVSGKAPTISVYYNASTFRDGTNYLDGVLLRSSGKWTYDKSYPSGFHVYSQSPTKAQSSSGGAPTHLAAARCYDKVDGRDIHTYEQGGQRVAEYALYNPKLTDDERTRAYRALRYKWFDEAPLTNALAVLSIPEGGSYEVKYEKIAVGNLEIGGTLGALGVSASNIVVSSDCAAIAAPLALASGAVLEFRRTAGGFTCLTADSVAAAGNCTVVLKADDWGGRLEKRFRIVRGAVTGGNWSVKCQDANLAARIVLDAEGALVELSKGLMVIYR